MIEGLEMVSKRVLIQTTLQSETELPTHSSWAIDGPRRAISTASLEIEIRTTQLVIDVTPRTAFAAHELERKKEST